MRYSSKVLFTFLAVLGLTIGVWSFFYPEHRDIRLPLYLIYCVVAGALMERIIAKQL